MLGLATALNSSSLKKKSVLTNKFSAELDGTGDYIDVSSLSSDIDKAAGTISMWVKVQATSGNESFFNCSDGTSGDNKLVLMYNTGSAVIQANYKAGGSSQDATHSIAGDDLTGLGWFHVAMTYNTSTPLIQLFLNGTRVAQRTSSLTQMSGDVAIDRVRLGSNANADNTYHHGNIDEFIYIAGKDLTESEMLLLYNNGKPDDIGDLPSAIYNAIKCWLRFGDGSIDGDADQTSVIFDEKNATLGSELVDNGNFATDSNWTKGTGWSIANGVASCDGTQSSTSNFSQGNTFDTPPQTLSDTYKITFDLVVTQGSITASSGSLSQSYTTSGSKILYGIPATGAGNLNFTAGSTFIGSIDNVSVKQVNGNPGFCVADATVGNSNVP